MNKHAESTCKWRVVGQVTEVNAEVNSEAGAQSVRPATCDLQAGTEIWGAQKQTVIAR